MLEEFIMKTYVVTGGSGFIGSTLAEDNKVINIDNFNNYYDLSIKIANILESTGNEQCTVRKRRKIKAIKKIS